MSNVVDTKKPKEKLDVFRFFGMDFAESGKDNIIGDCLFCGKEKHTFVERYKGLWDCKVCGRQGDISDFLTEIYRGIKEGTTEFSILKLAQYRRLPVEAFNNWELAFHPDNSTYFFPLRQFDGKITNLLYYRIGEKMRSLPNCDLGIYGLYELLHNVETKSYPVFIHEGIFNAIATNWLLKATDNKGICVATQGSNSFKADYVPYFAGKKIVWCLDNDGAGINGVERGHKILEPVAKKPDYSITWPEEFPPGYDTNDFISAYAIENPREGFDKFSKLLLEWSNWAVIKSNTVHANGQPKQTNANRSFDSSNIDSDLPPKGVITIPDMVKQYERFLDLNEYLIDTIKLCFATTLSIRIPGGSPVWLFIQGPPGSGKTEIITTFKKCEEYAYYQSNIRRNALVSGMPGQGGTDPSLIPKLHERCLFIKDYTEVLDKNTEDRKEIYSVLRGAFDGYLERDFGNGIKRLYDPIRFSLVAGVTSEILNYSDASVGERFIRYKISTEKTDFYKQNKTAMMHAFSGENTKDQIQNAVNIFLSQEWNFSPEFIASLIPDEWFYKKISALAQLTAWLRTPVVRHQFGINREELVYKPDYESPNRLALQFQRLAVSLAIIERKRQVDEKIWRLIQKVALDTVTDFKTTIVQILAKNKKPMTKNDIANAIDLGSSALYYPIEDLMILKLIERIRVPAPEGSNTKPYDTFQLSSKCKELFGVADLFDYSTKPKKSGKL
jgi:hypothetical protein